MVTSPPSPSIQPPLSPSPQLLVNEPLLDPTCGPLDGSCLASTCYKTNPVNTATFPVLQPQMTLGLFATYLAASVPNIITHS